jgi:hypothetical protein
MFQTQQSERTGTPSLALLLTAAALLATSWAVADDSPKPRVVAHAERSAPVTPFVFDWDVRDLPAPVKWQPGDPVTEIPRRRYHKPGFVPPVYETGLDPLVELQWSVDALDSIRAFTTPSRNFPGEPFTGVNPPDTVGDVGLNHYIQMVNQSGGATVRIWDKAVPTPNLLANFDLDSLGSGSCASGFGDPIVLYDRFADRWMLSEFSNSGNNLCVYISQTPDPVSGGWYAYGYTAPTFPDYPKYGVWPTDANGGQGSYIVTSNESGSGVYALDRAAMLTGTPGTYQRVLIPDLPGFSFNAVTPADIDGSNPPPSGSPALIMRQRDTENHSGPTAPGDVLEQWTYQVDWVTTTNTLLTQEPNIDIAEIDSALCGLSAFACFPQPGTSTTLDPLREVIMNRLQYTNWDNREVLMGNFVTDVDGNDWGGLRWFELEKIGGVWTVRQEGTYAPDPDHRWMAASAMDQSGNFAIAYNVSSSTTFPSLRFSGRQFDDPLGVLTETETVIHAGTASNSSNRYGDYSSMNVDPEDDCTFWFTGMDNTSSSWRTQVVSFAFDACGCELFPGVPAALAIVAGDNRIDIDWDDSNLSTVTEYQVRRSRTSGGPYQTIDVVPDSSPGAPGGAGYTYKDMTVSGGITYYYVVVASDGSACKTPSNEVSEIATGLCTLPPIFEGLQSVDTIFSGICTMQLFWDAATAECPGPIAYDVYRSQSSGFTPSAANLLISGVTNTTVTDLEGLATGEAYYYVVRATDTSNLVSEGNSVELSGIPLGQLTTGVWFDDGGDTEPAKMIPDAPWSFSDTGGNNGPAAYTTGAYGNNLCAGLNTPELRLGAGSVLTFYSQYAIENSWDKGEVQISTDGGVNWERVELAPGYPGTSTNTSDSCGLPTGTYFTGDVPNTWTAYTADLTAWGNQFVLLRFALSTDTSVNGSGWWIDDISITQVDVPGACATGSSCADNPLVDVVPDGPLDECIGTILTADVTGGTGPFSYRWTRDGEEIPGANSPNYTVIDSGSHSYNCRVSALSCPDEVFDGRDTEITTGNTPSFGGVISAVDPQSADCSVQVDWSAGSTLCDGPLRYYVYRDTTTPVSTTPDNLIASNLSGISFLDSGGLVSGTAYNYLVRAIDKTMGTFDSNITEVSVAPMGPGAGISTAYTEDFEDVAAFAQWTSTVQPSSKTCPQWNRVNTITGRPLGGTGFYASANSVPCGPPAVDTVFESPSINLDPAGTVLNVTMELDLYYNYGTGGDTATVEVWDGGAWNVVWTNPAADVNGHQRFDVTTWAANNPDFRIRFNYVNTDQWFSNDNISIEIDVLNSCAISFGPVPTPTGAGSTAPVFASRATPAGDVIDVDWDTASCTAVGYNLVYGDLANVSTYALAGSECSLGTAGTYNWSAVPAGDLFFLVIGTDGAATESSWGADSQFGERNGLTPSGQCGTVSKDISGSCP